MYQRWLAEKMQPLGEMNFKQILLCIFVEIIVIIILFILIALPFFIIDKIEEKRCMSMPFNEMIQDESCSPYWEALDE